MIQKRIHITPRAAVAIILGAIFVVAAILVPGHASVAMFVLRFAGILGIAFGIRMAVRR